MQEHACLLPISDRDDDVAMAAVPSGPAGRRGGFSGEVYREEDAACYVKKVKFAYITYCFIALSAVTVCWVVGEASSL